MDDVAGRDGVPFALSVADNEASVGVEGKGTPGEFGAPRQFGTHCAAQGVHAP
jgi:hypothetical protein